jgi:hypothetical protein
VDQDKLSQTMDWGVCSAHNITEQTLITPNVFMEVANIINMLIPRVLALTVLKEQWPIRLMVFTATPSRLQLVRKEKSHHMMD